MDLIVPTGLMFSPQLVDLDIFGRLAGAKATATERSRRLTRGTSRTSGAYNSKDSERQQVEPCAERY